MKHLVYLCLLFCTVSLSAQEKKLLVVAHDGSGDFQTIQDAVNAVRDFQYWRVTIFIKKGTYHEKLVIPSWKTGITLIGESRDSTIITNSDFSGKPYPGGRDINGKDKFSTFTSYTVLVQGNDVVLQNLTIENAAGQVGRQSHCMWKETGVSSEIANCWGTRIPCMPARKIAGSFMIAVI